MPDLAPLPRILIVGASRGLGHAMAERFVERGWHVTGTVRVAAGTPLHALAARHPRQVSIEALDVTDREQIAALRERLSDPVFDMLFVNAGIATRDQDVPVGEVDTDEFMQVMHTNVLGPMRVLEALHECVPAGGLVGVMSSGQGSVTNNEQGRREVYRASKAALNMSMRSFAARQRDSGRALVLMAPGWVRTELGGAQAPLTIDDSVPGVVQVLLGRLGTSGLAYLDYQGRTVPW